ncbi:Tryptophan synthase alpha chain [Chitinispirillum alkaliphilum]|nr:Tryptophan synthase alpha chain [Chitinispirillum alkaliphilum]
MNRYTQVFSKLKKRNEIAFVPFAVAGDPDPDLSLDILLSYVEGGADILEIGFPFSDPIADGPVNQRASQRSIQGGMDYSRFFSIVKKLRQKSDIPIGLLLYANSIHYLGYEKFCKEASEAGIDSMLVVDMPPEESSELSKTMTKYNIGKVFIVSELTPAKRMKYICSNVDSFVYIVSRLGATGADTVFSSSIDMTIKKLRSETDKPLLAGFGISTPEHVRSIATAGADGAIVGSALVRIVEESVKKGENPCALIKEAVAAYKTGTLLNQRVL